MDNGIVGLRVAPDLLMFNEFDTSISLKLFP